MSAGSGEGRKVADGGWEGAPRGGGVARVPPLLDPSRVAGEGLRRVVPAVRGTGFPPGLGPAGLGRVVLQVLFSLPPRCSATVGFTVRVRIPPSPSLLFSWLSSPHGAVPPVPLKPSRSGQRPGRPLCPAAGLPPVPARPPAALHRTAPGRTRRVARVPGVAWRLAETSRGPSSPLPSPPFPRACVCRGARRGVTLLRPPPPPRVRAGCHVSFLFLPQVLKHWCSPRRSRDVCPPCRSYAASAAKCAEGRDFCSNSPDRKYTESGRRATAEQLQEEGRGTAILFLL